MTREAQLCKNNDNPSREKNKKAKRSVVSE